MADFPAAKKFKQTCLNFSRPAASGSQISTKGHKFNQYKISFTVRPNNREGEEGGEVKLFIINHKTEYKILFITYGLD